MKHEVTINLVSKTLSLTEIEKYRFIEQSPEKKKSIKRYKKYSTVILVQNGEPTICANLIF